MAEPLLAERPDPTALSLPDTPDFDAYPVTYAAVSVMPTAHGIVVTWEDGRSVQFNRFWLRENEVAEGIITPATRERDLDIALLPDDLAAVSAHVDAVGAVVVEWAPDRHITRHHPSWLRAAADRQWAPSVGIPVQESWDAAAMPEPVSFDGPAVLEDDGALANWLTATHRYGLTRLWGLGGSEGTVARIAEQIGTIRSSSFGFVFSVESKPNPDSNAYTSGALTGHTDLPTRELLPGLQLLHCRENTCPDGFSTMVDGFKVAEHIRDTDPEAFASLTQDHWLSSNRHQDFDYRWSAPIVVADGHGAITDIRIANNLRAEPDMLPERTEIAYRALRLFMRLIAADQFVCRYPFESGDLVIFDNRRIPHGRDAFNPNGGVRRLEGCYVDRDELLSRLRILARRERARQL